MTFTEYLETQLGRPKNPDIGDYVRDFAEEVIHDTTRPPDSASRAEWLDYLASENAIPQAISSFEIAWQEFRNLSTQCI